ncbi:MAG: DNA translocase FtsK [Acidimicrobiia bacterium]
MTKRASSRSGAKRAGRGSKHKQSRIGSMGAALASIPTRIRHRLGRQADDVWGVILLVTAGLLGLAFFGLSGPMGRGLVLGLTFLFGAWSVVVPFVLVGIGVSLIVGRSRRSHGRMAAGISIAFVGCQALYHHLTGGPVPWEIIQGGFADAEPGVMGLLDLGGGVVGSLVAFPTARLLGTWGAALVLSALTITGVLIAAHVSFREFVFAIGDLWKGLSRWMQGLTTTRPPVVERRPHQPEIVGAGPSEQGPTPASRRPAKHRPADDGDVVVPDFVAAEDDEDDDEPVPMAVVDTAYELPPLELLGTGESVVHNRRSLEQTADQLADTLRQHGVDAELTKIVPGPTVTRYEIELAAGVKVNKVTNLAHDIAYALATPDVRLLAPIPGKSAIGVEVPNRQRRLVTLGDVLGSEEAERAQHPLSVGLGMDISGKPLMLNLSELPHVLIAGATGAGKSSCINSLVTSLLMRTHPEDVRLIMVDPKRVELGQYNGVPHLLTKVITNPRKAADALKWAVEEMDRRYDLLADGGVRDIVGYRQKLDAGELDPDGFDRFPYLVVLIDELNDLMMVAGREVEDSVVRIAQMARAVGIHLVIATQRPSVNVITGVIKANVPSRLAFSVASQTDSRVIIDSAGAEKLVGMGDMLVVTAKEPRPRRIQGCWVEEDEIHAVVDWVKAQKEARYEDAIIAQAAEAARAASAEEDDEDEVLVRQAIEIVVSSQLGSTSMLQRKLRIGFARAGRVMDILETRGVVGPSLGSKAREVLWTTDDLMEHTDA